MASKNNIDRADILMMYYDIIIDLLLGNKTDFVVVDIPMSDILIELKERGRLSAKYVKSIKSQIDRVKLIIESIEKELLFLDKLSEFKHGTLTGVNASNFNNKLDSDK